MSAVTVIQAYRFALDPSAAQARNLERHVGAARFAFNWALARVKANIGQRAAERSYGLGGEELTPALAWNLPALRRAWNAAKPEVAPWWSECSKEAFNTGLDGVARSLRNWADSASGKRSGRKVGFPRFKARRRTTPSVRFTTGVIRVESDRRHVTLPRVGTIKTHESTRKLARRLESGTARILSATVRLEAGRWHCAFTVEVVRQVHVPARPDATVGVDLGIKVLAVLSTGDLVPNPRHVTRALKALRTASRTLSRRVGPDRRTGQRPSARWESAQREVTRIHVRVANLRKDAIHKLTSELAAIYGVVVVEDLNVLGMLKNHKLARHIADASFGEIRRQLGYKTGWNGGRLVIADRWFPSSKTCSGCGTVKPKLSMADRIFTCDACGLVIDRDLNAALNLKQYVDLEWPGDVKTGRGADQKTKPSLAGGCETPTPHHPGGQDGDRRPVTIGCER
ncbi:putative transposase [Kibdelosporangium banguiense]|uniref:Transposase n=1 Tax=Kibdelosporangium banguiense TaxID=1365924 RepID=A0ABS4U184_9PSEU|nr:IS607 family element RNA-guided endonuclease TnpB [Kibdelosporangium banguiense]MBP2329960.1 putative transposase [Kibdelosporangium banguiense]